MSNYAVVEFATNVIHFMFRSFCYGTLPSSWSSTRLTSQHRYFIFDHCPLLLCEYILCSMWPLRSWISGGLWLQIEKMYFNSVFASIIPPGESRFPLGREIAEHTAWWICAHSASYLIFIPTWTNVTSSASWIMYDNNRNFYSTFINHISINSQFIEWR